MVEIENAEVRRARLHELRFVLNCLEQSDASKDAHERLRICLKELEDVHGSASRNSWSDAGAAERALLKVIIDRALNPADPTASADPIGWVRRIVAARAEDLAHTL